MRHKRLSNAVLACVLSASLAFQMPVTVRATEDSSSMTALTTTPSPAAEDTYEEPAPEPYEETASPETSENDESAPSEEPAPTEAPEEADPTEAPEENEPTTAPEEGEPTEAPKEGEPTEAPKEGEPTTAPEEGEPTKAPEEGEPTTAPEEGEPTTAPEEGEPTTAPEEGEPTEAPEEGEPTTAPEEGEPTEAPEEGEPTAAPEEGEPTAAPEEGEPTKVPEEGEPTTAPEEAEPTAAPGDVTPTVTPTETPEGATPTVSPTVTPTEGAEDLVTATPTPTATSTPEATEETTRDRSESAYGVVPAPYEFHYDFAYEGPLVEGVSVNRQKLIAFGKQFLGNPYVWGGESLTNGCDCSGFTMQVYRQFGIELPRTSREQAEAGTKIPIEEALPGDLVFYSKNGTVYHVMIYIGEGKILHASSSTTGIVISNLNYSKVCWACRFINDSASSTLAENLTEMGVKAAAGDEEARREILRQLSIAAASEWEVYGYSRAVLMAQIIEDTNWLSFDKAEEGGIEPADNNVLSLTEHFGEGTDWLSLWSGRIAQRVIDFPGEPSHKELIKAPHKLSADTEGGQTVLKVVKGSFDESVMMFLQKVASLSDIEETQAEDGLEETAADGTKSEEQAADGDTADGTKSDEQAADGDSADGTKSDEKAADGAQKAVSEGKDAADKKEADVDLPQENIRLYADIESCMADYAAYVTAAYPEVAEEKDADKVIGAVFGEDEVYAGLIRELVDDYNLTYYDNLLGNARTDNTPYTTEDMELIWALVAQEDDTSYEGALAVITSVMNRADINYDGYGTTAIQQLTADGQFCYSPKVSAPILWQRRLSGNVPKIVKQAVEDCLIGGVRNHNFLNFRSRNANGNRTRIGGNWYF